MLFQLARKYLQPRCLHLINILSESVQNVIHSSLKMIYFLDWRNIHKTCNTPSASGHNCNRKIKGTPKPFTKTLFVYINLLQVLPRFDAQNNVVPEEIVCVSASADHRVVDGASMASFIELVRKQIENPNVLLLNLINKK